MKSKLTLLFLSLSFITIAQEQPTNSLKEKGYFNYTSIGSLIGSSNDVNTHIASFLMEHNYQIDKNLSVGVTTGLEWFDVLVLPLGANAKLLLPKKNQAAFFTGLSTGYAFALEDMEFMDIDVLDTKGGAFFNAEIGYLFPSKHQYNVFVAMGYRYHIFEFTRSDWMMTEVTRKTIYNRFSLRLGLRLF
jgi:hypothetical protein